MRSRLALVNRDLRHDRFLGGFCSMLLLVPFVTSLAVQNTEWNATQKLLFLSIPGCSCHSLLHLIGFEHVPLDDGMLQSTANGIGKVLLLDR